MQIEEKISELERQLPYGSKKIIADRAGVTEKTVANCLKGETKKSPKRLKILSEAAKYLKEYNDAEKSILENISA